MNMLERLLRRAYRSLRGSEIPLEVPLGVLVGISFERIADLVRGTVRSTTYAQSRGLHVRGGRVRVRSPRYLRIGRGVIINADVLVDCFSSDGVRLGDAVTVGRGTMIMGSGVIREPGVGVEIGDRTAIGAYNVIWGQGGVIIGDDCLLGPNVTIVSENHDYSDTKRPIRTQPGLRDAIVIGNDCWIAAGATVLAGVRIGDGSVIGAGAVVTMEIPPRSIAVGVPARIVGQRG